MNIEQNKQGSDSQKSQALISNSTTQVQKEHKGYKIGFFLLMGVFLILLGAFGSWFFLSQKDNRKIKEAEKEVAKISPEYLSPTVEIQNKETNEASLSADSETKETDKTSDLKALKKAMADRHHKNENETIITISKNNGTHAAGGVRFEGEISGGWFLAAKRGNEWVIVADGNGTVSCEVIEPWRFPADMVPECVDKEGNLINR